METMNLFLADIRPLAEREGEVIPLLTPSRRTEVERYRPREDRLHSMAAGLLLHAVLGVRKDEDLCRSEFGKPALTGEGPCFNLTHGGHYALLAVFSSPVGVDIEPVGERMPPIPKRFLTSDELAWLERDPTPERFAYLWTRLECVLKADGRGFGMEQRDFSVLDDALWQIKTLSYDGHIISCGAEKEFEVKLVPLTAEELLK